MISLITATLGRVKEIGVLLESLVQQQNQNFEFILIDQNEHHELEPIIKQYEQKIDIIYIRSSVKGLSYNRNIGLKNCKGDIIGFPDDDCFYDSAVLSEVEKKFINSEIQFCAFATKDSINRNVVRYKKNEILTRKDVFKYCISYNVFVRKNGNIFFDDRLGVGRKYSSGEETDYLFALLRKKDKGYFINDVFISHPCKDETCNLQRTYSYSLGTGAIFRKEIVARRNYFYSFIFIYYLLRSVAGIMITSNRSLHWNGLKGKIVGFVNFR